MILAHGTVYPSQEQNRLLEGLEEAITATLQREPFPAQTVIDACEALVARLERGEFDAVIAALGLDGRLKEEQVSSAVALLRRDSLEAKLNLELGAGFAAPQAVQPPHHEGTLVKQVLPLGVLFHIAAGNVDGLPAYSVVEGLLAGNVNLLKLPQADEGLSVLLLKALVEEAPVLTDYVYVFDTPSDDIPAMERMAALADGIVVWGGDAAVSAVRAMAPVGTKLIEWGHRLSFAYVTEGRTAEQLRALARHIIDTRQLLCSSCQTILLDTSDEAAVTDFCREFLPILEEAARRSPLDDVGAAGKITLALYNQSLEEIQDKRRTTFRGAGCSLTACSDGELELSLQFGNPLVKAMPRAQLPAMLRRHKGYLQTAGLLCAPEEREELSALLLRAGLVRVTGAGDLSRVTCCDAHDGEYPLRRYTRVTER